MKRIYGVFAVALIAALTGGSPPAQAGTAPGGWWGGNWSCTIDGRPARMRWMIVNVNSGSCNGDTCTSSEGAAWRGRFSDSGSQWVTLSSLRPSGGGGIRFNHADGNTWFLPKPVNNRSKGWTTWQGQRYPLACWR